MAKTLAAVASDWREAGGDKERMKLSLSTWQVRNKDQKAYARQVETLIAEDLDTLYMGLLEMQQIKSALFVALMNRRLVRH